MCGIFCSICPKHALKPDQQTLENLKARGPDSFKEHIVVLPASQTGGSRPASLTLTFVATVLALRGDHIQVQPLVDTHTNSVLCWNGEAWKFNSRVVSGNDTSQVFELLLSASNAPRSRDEVLRVLTTIAGPFAFVYFDAISSTLYYGRDRLGRRSLMISRDAAFSLIISSNSTNSTYSSCNEVDTATIHALDLSHNLTELENLPWHEAQSGANRDLPPDQHLPATPTPSTVSALQSQLRDALRLRVAAIPSLADRSEHPVQSKVAILFSGGLDCTILARITHDLLSLDQSIDLLNVAFENPRSIKAANLSTDSSPYEICPDRSTGRSSYAELTKSCPGRRWRFVAINVPYAETCQHRPRIIDLMHPHATEMDLSIAMALYFAARGIGVLHDNTVYATPARVLLSGLGADELFAGYTRHATAFSRGGFQSLVEELDLDFTRIGTRNLGRDDRVMSYWGREVRYPYLDETFIAFTLQLPVWEKCGFRTGQLRPTSDNRGKNTVTRMQELDRAKMLLRLLAWDLGLPIVAAEKKRAIQFGARTAKMELLAAGQRRSKGTDAVV
jgi:asparagine synthetase B (glutamine-hydrolysing)